jgi:superfamily II DNA/RNA helicase
MRFGIFMAPFHPAVREWFASRLGEPSPPQREGWPLIREGRHALIAAPTGSGKTLAAFLSAIDTLFRQGAELRDETQVLRGGAQAHRRCREWSASTLVYRRPRLSIPARGNRCRGAG